jgi:hypothetical protein
VPVLIVVPGEKGLTVLPGGFDGGEVAGKSGRYFMVLNWASLNGLSSQDVRAGCVTG